MLNQTPPEGAAPLLEDRSTALDAAPEALPEPQTDAVASDPVETPVTPPPTHTTIERDAPPPQQPQQPQQPESLKAGERLRQARLAAGLTLEQVSDKLRLRREYLSALEEMNLKLLPGKAYALPYLRSYAAFLNLDAKAMLAQFQAESALSREDATPQIFNPDSKPTRERPWIWALALAVVAGGFVAYRVFFAGPAEQVADRAPSQSAPQSGVQRPVAPAVEGDGLPRGVAAQSVEIKALAPAWLEVRTPGGTVMLSQELRAGQVYQPDSGAGWTLHARDGSAFEVFLNGASVGVLGLAGQPVLGRQVDAIAAAAVQTVEAAPRPVAAPLPGPTARASASIPAPAGGPGASPAIPAPAATSVPTPSAPPAAGAAPPTPATRPVVRAERPARPAVAAKQPAGETGQPASKAEPKAASPDAWEVGETPPPGTDTP